MKPHTGVALLFINNEGSNPTSGAFANSTVDIDGVIFTIRYKEAMATTQRFSRDPVGQGRGIGDTEPPGTCGFF